MLPEGYWFPAGPWLEGKINGAVQILFCLPRGKGFLSFPQSQKLSSLLQRREKLAGHHTWRVCAHLTHWSQAAREGHSELHDVANFWPYSDVNQCQKPQPGLQAFNQTSCGICCSALTFGSCTVCTALTGTITSQPPHIFQNATICSSADRLAFKANSTHAMLWQDTVRHPQTN